MAVPEGVAPPAVVVISDTSVRVSWQAPAKPNGPITAYLLHVNRPISAYLLHVDDAVVDPHTAWPSFYVVEDLQPYTVYEIQVAGGLVYEISYDNRTITLR